MIIFYKNKSMRMTIIFWILLFQVQTFYDLTILQQSVVKPPPTSSSIPSMISNNSSIVTSEIPLITPKLLVNQNVSILFIVDNAKVILSYWDETFYNFMTLNLSFSVTYHTANDSYNYTGYDAIVISKSVGTSPVGSLTNATIPILTMDNSNWDEFHLGTGSIYVPLDEIWNITFEPHYILEDETAGETVAISSAGSSTNALLGFDNISYPQGCEVKQLAYTTTKDSESSTLVTLEKDALNFNLFQSKERRAYWGATGFKGKFGSILFTTYAWELWNKTLHWILYDDYKGNATINVQVQNLDSKNIKSANVQLKDSTNASLFWDETTTNSGIATFTNIPWGEYNISVSFSTEVNNTLTNLEIIPELTYTKNRSFDYFVTLDVIIDNINPVIVEIKFDNKTSTFYANVTDDSEFDVYLNLTAHNLSTGAVEIHLQNFTMVPLSDDTYYNDSALDSLPVNRVNITYNIIAEDSFGNSYASPIQTFAFDEVPPIIWNSHFDNSTSTFFTNVSDDSLIKYVNLSLTIRNISTGFVVPPYLRKNYSMVYLSGNTYFNDTALDLLANSDVNITYSIIAGDIYGNYYETPNVTFDLGDTTAPEIHIYNATDYGNGTIVFYANITDENGIQAPVVLDINGTHYNMFENASNWWIYRGEFEYGISLNYTIYSVINTIGNENGTKTYPAKIGSEIHIPLDLTPPIINQLIDYPNYSSILKHEKGNVTFLVEIEENPFGSGVNDSKVELFLVINGNYTEHLMTHHGDNIFFFEYTFEYNDSIVYWIRAFDNVNNWINSTRLPELGSYTINDNEDPIVTFWIDDLGNGTIKFYADVSDWPDNNTASMLFYTTNYPIDWLISSMDKIDDNLFQVVISFSYQTQNIWYYVNTTDSESNSIQTSEKSLSLVDTVVPEIQMTYINSSVNDGEISIFANAVDPFGELLYVNNTFFANITYQSTTTTYEMSYDSFYNYNLTLNYPFQTILTVTIYVEDELGNLGSITKTIFVDDITPPKIMQYGEIDHQNGTVTIWAEIIEGVNGSGLLEDNSSVHLEYIYSNEIIPVTMEWNGTKNFYSFSIEGFIPDNSFSFGIIAVDKNGNINQTIPKIFSIGDTVNPEIIGYGTIQEKINHTHISIYFWVNAIDPFGSVSTVILSFEYSYFFSSHINEISMTPNGTHYVFEDLVLICNTTFNYTILIADSFSNAGSHTELDVKTLDFSPTEVSDHGVDYPTSEPGNITFWIEIEENSFDDETVTLIIYNHTSDELLMAETLMTNNGTHHYLSYPIKYNTNITYIMNVADPGSLLGYYEIESPTNTIQMQDNCEPVIHKKGSIQINDTLIFWANISDWGSNIADVFLYLNFSSQSATGGIGAEQVVYSMEPNDTKDIYTYNISITEEGEYSGFIVVYDQEGNVATIDIVPKSVYLPPENIPESGIDPLVIVGAILGTIIIFGSVLMIVRSYRKRTKEKQTLTKSFKQKLTLIPNIYSLIVTSGVGVPILNVTNVLYLKDSEMNGALSGLSVGIDSFLESFQSDFISQLQEDNVISDDTSSQTRLSLIEKQRVQILIGASPSYRMFLFLKEKPSDYIRELFHDALVQTERNIPLEEQGIVDESIIAPRVFAILQSRLPILLLYPFMIDIKRVVELDVALRQGDVVGLSRNEIDALKQLIMVKSLNLPRNEIKQKINSFNKIVTNNRMDKTGKLIFTEAANIMENLLGIHVEIIFQALWKGCSPDMKIIIPGEKIKFD